MLTSYLGFFHLFLTRILELVMKNKKWLWVWNLGLTASIVVSPEENIDLAIRYDHKNEEKVPPRAQP